MHEHTTKAMKEKWWIMPRFGAVYVQLNKYNVYFFWCVILFGEMVRPEWL